MFRPHSGQSDNVIANARTILISGTGTTLAFSGASISSAKRGTESSTTATAARVLQRHARQLLLLFYAPTPGNQTVAQTPYINDSDPGTNGGHAGRRDQFGWLFFTSVPIAEGKTVTVVMLPTGGGTQNGRIVGMHVCAIGIG